MTVRIGGDDYLGYWFITSPEMRKQAAQRGIGVQFTDDGGAYAERLEKFAAGEYDAIVLPVNSYLQHGAVGAVPRGDRRLDRRVQRRRRHGRFRRLPAQRQARGPERRRSPDRLHLGLAERVSARPDDRRLRSRRARRRRAAGGSEAESSASDVYKRAKNNQGDVFVLWEPDLSRALSLPGMSYIWGSDRFSGYIVDVFVFRREFLRGQRRSGGRVPAHLLPGAHLLRQQPRQAGQGDPPVDRPRRRRHPRDAGKDRVARPRGEPAAAVRHRSLSPASRSTTASSTPSSPAPTSCCAPAPGQRPPRGQSLPDHQQLGPRRAWSQPPPARRRSPPAGDAR